MERFLYHFWTGCGSNRVVLTLAGDSANLRIRTNWMGEGLKRYNLRCGHRVLSPAFGVLVVEAIEAAVGNDAPFTPVTIDPEEFLLPLVIEYVRVPTSPVYVHEESQNVVAAPLGYAGWNETFEVALMVHDFEGRAQASPLAETCNTIDKVKLGAWAGDEAEG
jgi:hypothetical protein